MMTDKLTDSLLGLRIEDTLQFRTLLLRYTHTVAVSKSSSTIHRREQKTHPSG